MKADTAERLAEWGLQMSDELNEMLRHIQANEPADECVRLRHRIGRVMWAVYYEILKPTFEEHPALEPEAGSEPGPATMTRRRSPRAARAADRLPPPSAPGPRRPRQPRRSRG